MKRKYNVPFLVVTLIKQEDGLLMASYDTSKENPLITEEEVLTDEKDWLLDLDVTP